MDQTAAEIVLTDGVDVASIVPSVTPVQAAWDVNPITGTLYVVWTDTAGDGGFAWGTLSTGFTTAEVTLPWPAKELTVMAQSDGSTALIVAINAANAAQAVVVAP